MRQGSPETELLVEETRIEMTVGKIGDYELQREIGRGGMGVVYDAWQHSMERRVALKVLPPSVATDSRDALLRHGTCVNALLLVPSQPVRPRLTPVK